MPPTNGCSIRVRTFWESRRDTSIWNCSRKSSRSIVNSTSICIRRADVRPLVLPALGNRTLFRSHPRSTDSLPSSCRQQLSVRVEHPSLKGSKLYIAPQSYPLREFKRVVVRSATFESRYPLPQTGANETGSRVAGPGSLVEWDDSPPWSGTVAGVDQSVLLPPRELATEEGKFLNFKGVEVYYREADPKGMALPGHTQAGELHEKRRMDSRFEGAPGGGNGGYLAQEQVGQGQGQGHEKQPCEEPHSGLGMPAVLLHGFGASSFSWEEVLSPLAVVLDAPTVAFDRPGFGLTSRVRPPPDHASLADPQSNPYSLQFSAEAAVEFATRLGRKAALRPLIVGHSAGCLVAVHAYLSAPSAFSGLVLVAPAIVPSFAGPCKPHDSTPEGFSPPGAPSAADPASAASPLLAAESLVDSAAQQQGKTGVFPTSSAPTSAQQPATRVVALLQLTLLQVTLFTVSCIRAAADFLVRTAIGAGRGLRRVQRAAKGVAPLEQGLDAVAAIGMLSASLLSLLLHALGSFLAAAAAAMWGAARCFRHGLQGFFLVVASALLRNGFSRALVRRVFDVGAIPIVRSAWVDAAACTPRVIQGYTKPLQCRHWDRAFLEFVIALCLNPQIAARLHEISCPVLVVTGDRDTIVPAWNSERLAKAIPGAEFHVIPSCGHLPQEEKPGELLALIGKFAHAAASPTSQRPVQNACTGGTDEHPVGSDPSGQ